MNQKIHFHRADQPTTADSLLTPWLDADRIRILADDRFREAPVMGPIAKYWENSPKCFVPAGEASKSIETAQRVWSWLDDQATDRGHTLVILGGGTITDLGGFVASTYKRGIPFILIPTTIVGMIDASIGGKNGINFSHYKNQIGLFQLPVFTFIDSRFIATLNAHERTNGWMELVKHCLIDDALLWNDIAKTDIHKGGSIQPWIQRAAQIKQNIIAQDFLDHSVRKTLNYGHSLAHALEWKAQQDNLSIGHGIAVGWGMIWANAWSASLHPSETRALSSVTETIQAWLDQIPEQNQSNWLRDLNPEELWTAILRDKKNRNGVVLDVALKSVGTALWDQSLTLNQFTSIWKQVFE